MARELVVTFTRFALQDLVQSRYTLTGFNALGVPETTSNLELETTMKWQAVILKC